MIWAEHINHFKDMWYLFLRDHKPTFAILLLLALLVPPIKSFNHGGTTTNLALLGWGREDPKYAKSRWLIKTNVCLYENIPQIFIVMTETFLAKKSFAFTDVLFPAFSALMSIRHLGRVTGEWFIREQNNEGVIDTTVQEFQRNRVYKSIWLKTMNGLLCVLLYFTVPLGFLMFIFKSFFVDRDEITELLEHDLDLL